jgi:hypothetical protein
VGVYIPRPLRPVSYTGRIATLEKRVARGHCFDFYGAWGAARSYTLEWLRYVTGDETATLESYWPNWGLGVEFSESPPTSVTRTYGDHSWTLKLSDVNASWSRYLSGERISGRWSDDIEFLEENPTQSFSGVPGSYRVVSGQLVVKKDWHQYFFNDLPDWTVTGEAVFLEWLQERVLIPVGAVSVPNWWQHPQGLNWAWNRATICFDSIGEIDRLKGYEAKREARALKRESIIEAAAESIKL